jgi:hypothetical protein
MRGVDASGSCSSIPRSVASLRRLCARLWGSWHLGAAQYIGASWRWRLSATTRRPSSPQVLFGRQHEIDAAGNYGIRPRMRRRAPHSVMQTGFQTWVGPRHDSIAHYTLPPAPERMPCCSNPRGPAGENASPSTSPFSQPCPRP